jgi:hypothetical protein
MRAFLSHFSITPRESSRSSVRLEQCGERLIAIASNAAISALVMPRQGCSVTLVLMLNVLESVTELLGRDAESIWSAKANFKRNQFRQND